MVAVIVRVNYGMMVVLQKQGHITQSQIAFNDLLFSEFCFGHNVYSILSQLETIFISSSIND